MGETLTDLPKDSEKMVGDTTASNPVLEVSVSFGRFENDSLSWEKWSAFSPNKYLEEVEKCATPGSVAQKKAYFEAHYKKIAARKAELLEQEKQAQNYSMTSEDDGVDPNGGDLVRNTSSMDAQIDVSEDQISAEEVKQEPSLSSEKMGGEKSNDLKDEVVIGGEFQRSVAEREEELDTRVAGSPPKLGKAEEEAHILVKEVEAMSIDSQPEKEAQESVKSEIGCDSKVKEEKVEFVDHCQSQKVTAVDKERNAAKAKKKPVSQITKTPKSSSNSTPRVSRPVPNSSRLSASASQSLTKKSNTIVTPSLQRNKNTSSRGTKKVVSKSLHMSLGLGPGNSNSPTHSNSPALNTPRKSLIMEKMGDKDIVKRAFKAFQNNFNQARSHGDDGSSLRKQVQATKRPEPKVSSSLTPRKENVGSLKMDHPVKRSVKTPPSSFGLKSDERAEKRIELLKKMEKSNAIEEEKTRLQSRPKEANEPEIKKLRQSLNFKATSMPAFYGGQKTSKGTLDKMPSKKEPRR